MRFGGLVVAAGLSGLLSFALLALAIGTEYWYIITVDQNQQNSTSTNTAELSSSHSGLWRIYEERNGSYHAVSIYMNTTESSEHHQHLSNLHSAIVILLPVSLVLLVFGGIFGLVASLARSYKLLSGEAVYFLICSLFTLSGVCIYVSYSEQALDLLQWELGAELPDYVHVSFGWSLTAACLSFCLELLTSVLLTLAARLAYCQLHHESTVTLSMT
ncbi:transmembrane protein 235-like [Astyanax mexicanus]|uniref:transmembrane protein 235-like n=1 Tax=Astyanax mexicanus TaxID=7994 RepID=UPI0020CB57CB|nr:transmembrane protein 235-like [Astyanax mexicanus]